MQNALNRVPGYHGEIHDCALVQNNMPPSVVLKPDLDLVGMARWALEALKKNPRPHLDYECRFSMSLLKYPPCPGPDDHDSITLGDTDNRMDWEFGYLKDMTGDTSADEAARGVRQRVLSYLRRDGLCWVPQDMNGQRVRGIYATAWTTGKLLSSLSNDYRRTRDKRLRARCRAMFEALRKRASWIDGRAFYAGGYSFWDYMGWLIGPKEETTYRPPMVMVSVLNYYEAFGDKEALDFAVAFAEGEMADDQWHNWVKNRESIVGVAVIPTDQQPADANAAVASSAIAKAVQLPKDDPLGVRPDGSFAHHSHMRGHHGWGMAHLASITHEARLVSWCKRLLDFYLSRGTDFGWIPESMTVPKRSETCAVADVIDMAAYMAKCGYPEYWDTVERFVRNYIREAQFFCTPEYEKLYRSLHPGEEGDKGLAMARELEGGFQGGMGLTDRVNVFGEMDMMGCCVPEGMRALHTAWKNTVTSEKDGVYVNMCFDRDAPEAKVVSKLPFKGQMTVVPKVAKDFQIRSPSWAPRDSIRVYRSGKLIPTSWRNAYVFIKNVEKGEVLTVTYPLVSFVQHQIVRNGPAGKTSCGLRKISVTWLGNTVTKLEPAGEKLPLYQQVPRLLPKLSK